MKRLFFIAFFIALLPNNLANSVGLDFGSISYIPGGGDLNATLDPVTGAIVCTNSNNYTCEPTGTPGTTTILGSVGSVVDISCRITARISNGGAFTFDVARSEVYIPNQNKTRCNNLRSTVLTHTISANSSNNIVYWGGRLKVRNSGNSNISGAYTSNGGGNSRPQTIRVTFL